MKRHKAQLTSQTIRLEHRLGKAKTLEEKVKILERFLEKNGQALHGGKELWLHKLNQFKRMISKGQSRFEWVDSVLVDSIVHGEWVIFENANLCNPSILDRLNSLLEEGNQSLSINE